MPLEPIIPVAEGDSTAAIQAMSDSVAPWPVATWWRGSHGVADESPLLRVEGEFKSARSEYVHGLKGENHTPLAGSDNGVVVMMVVIFLLICSNYRYYATYFKTYTKDVMWGRGRKNALDDRHTVSETRVLVSLVILLCMCEGMLLYSYISSLGAITVNATVGVAVSAGAAVLYM